uniref:Glucosylceramidase n=1 Tax=Arcella intermedia TaxID=1963864 RepID=A0A6B2KXX7_9EUKA
MHPPVNVDDNPTLHTNPLVHKCWDFNGVKGNSSTYYGLFPQAWTVYNEPDPDLELKCHQISPVIPHNYSHSSIPAGVFVWTAKNNSPHVKDLSLLFTFQNGTGGKSDAKGGHQNTMFRHIDEDYEYIGISMKHDDPREIFDRDAHKTVKHNDPVSFAVATRIESKERRLKDNIKARATFATTFQTNSEASLTALWSQFKKRGELDNTNLSEKSKPGTTIGSALAVKKRIGPNEVVTITFSIAWDCPIARFKSGGKAFYRRYTRYFGKRGEAIQRIAIDALKEWTGWHNQITKWQRPYLKEKEKFWSKKMRSALFNELNYLVGSTLWTNGSLIMTEEETQLVQSKEYMGGFYCLSDYGDSIDSLIGNPKFDIGPTFNNCDQLFTGGHALALLWPHLAVAIQKAIVTTVKTEKKIDWQTLLEGISSYSMSWQRKKKGTRNDTVRRQDLNLKFVLQVYRDFRATDDKAFLKLMWPLVRRALKHSKEKFDLNFDGMLESVGGDSTYYTWPSRGCTAYTGGLWVAALKAAKVMAYYRKDISHYVYFDDLYKRSAQIYVDELWNGKYFKLDNSESKASDSLMAEQLVGNWYSISCGLGRTIPTEQAKIALLEIYNKNMCTLPQGKIGVVNGTRPDGSIDSSCLHSKLICPNVNFVLAAAMYQLGLKTECLNLLNNMIDTIYNQMGYCYQMPAAFSADGSATFGSSMCSGLSIWALRWSFESEISFQSSEFKSTSEEYDEKFEQNMTQRIAMLNDKQLKRRENPPPRTINREASVGGKTSAVTSTAARPVQPPPPVIEDSLLNSVRTKVSRSLSFMF